MAYAYTKEQTNNFNMRNISKSVRNYFVTYEMLCDSVKDFSIHNLTVNTNSDIYVKSNKKSDTVWSSIIEHENLVKKLDKINEKIEYLKKYRFTDDEKKIFEYSILQKKKMKKLWIQ